MRRALALLAIAGGLAACDRADMVAQPKAKNWDRNTFFPDGSTVRQPVAGTQPRNEPNLPVPQPAVITAALLTRGQQRYNIFCLPCHGQSGDGRGMIVQRGFPAPPAFTNEGLLKADAQHFYDVITNGRGVMYSYADRVPPADRWAIAAYIRALQLSQQAPAAMLQAADRTALKAKP